ncbi:unnamed protein product [Linum trigynum]|uniref:Clp R domain-containing protein n=1 Tax=Linum trigynum TaxID=586398 RepID=A0AAV2DPW3_9ROSI
MAAQSLTTNLQSVHQSNLQKSKLQSPVIQSLKPYTLTNPSWLGNFQPIAGISLQSLNSRTRRGSSLQPVCATVSSLPTAKPERFASGDKVPQWSWRAIKAFALAALEARKLKCPKTGTEALLMGVMIEGTSVAAKYLWGNGITLFKVRDEITKLRGKPDFYYFPPEQPPVTEDAQRALDWAVDHKIKSGISGEITTSDVLLGIWSETDSPGHKILATLGFDDEKAKELDSKSAGPGLLEG